VAALTNGDTYTFTVTATNAAGTGPASSASASVTPTSPVAGLALITAYIPASATLTCTNQNSVDVSCSVVSLGSSGTFSAFVELVNSSGQAVANTQSAITVALTNTTLVAPGSVSFPGTLDIPTGASTTSNRFSLSGLGAGWQSQITVTAVVNSTTYTVTIICS
jgi:hypothetical protein